jgi:hypothetical protein
VAFDAFRCQPCQVTRPLLPHDDLLRLARAAIFNARDLLGAARALLDAGSALLRTRWRHSIRPPIRWHSLFPPELLPC